MAKDSFDREIDYLRVSVTDRCNLGCIYCMPKDKPRPFEQSAVMTDEEIFRIVRVATEGIGVRQVRLTGGEPLVRQGIVELVRRLGTLGLRDLSLTTNGVKLGQLAAELKAAGLTRLNISLDSMRPERFREITGCGELEQALAGIRAAEELGLEPIKINMVPIRGINDDEVADFARMTIEKPVHIRFIEFMPSGREGLWDASRCVKAEEVKARIEAEVGQLVQRQFKGRGPSRNYTFEGGRGIVGFISAVSHSFCYSCNRLRLNALGRLRPCLFSKTEVDILGPLREGADDSELLRLFRLALDIKPEGNYLKEPRKAAIKTMSQIGG